MNKFVNRMYLTLSVLVCRIYLMKDYWEQAYKEFFYVGLFGVFLSGVFFISWMLNAEWIRVVENQTSQISILNILFYFVVITIWLALGWSFKKRKVWAIKFGYILVGLIFLLSLYSFSVIGILISIYFLWIIRKAQKQSTAKEVSDLKMWQKVGFVLLVLIVLFFTGDSFSGHGTVETTGLPLIQVQDIANKINETLPIVIDSELTFDSVVVVENKLTSRFEFSDGLYLEEIKERVVLEKEDFKVGFCDEISPSNMKLLRDIGLLVVSRYYDVEGNYVGGDEFSLSECR